MCILAIIFGQIVSIIMSDEQMMMLGRAFAALGAKPEYTASQLEQWMIEQVGNTGQSVGSVKHVGSVKQEDGLSVDDQGDGSKDNKPTVDLSGASLLHHASIPRFPPFSGEKSKGDGGYYQWRYEVSCLHKDSSVKSNIVLQAIRRSVKGTAADILLNLGDDVSVSEVLEKFDVVFGDVLSSEQVLEKFYSAKQDRNENIIAWGCRIEGILEMGRKIGAISELASKDMLRSKFWSGLSNHNLKSALRHQYDGQSSYSELFRYARSVESEFESSGQKVKCHQLTSDDKPAKQVDPDLGKKVDKILEGMEKLNNRVYALETKVSQELTQSEQKHSKKKSKYRCFKCGSPDHVISKCPKNKKGNYKVSTKGDDK